MLTPVPATFREFRDDLNEFLAKIDLSSRVEVDLGNEGLGAPTSYLNLRYSPVHVSLHIHMVHSKREFDSKLYSNFGMFTEEYQARVNALAKLAKTGRVYDVRTRVHFASTELEADGAMVLGSDLRYMGEIAALIQNRFSNFAVFLPLP